MGIFADTLLMDIVYFAAIGVGAVLCCGACYLVLWKCFLIERTGPIKLPAPVELVIIKTVAWEEEMKKEVPERQLNRGELRKKREREREQSRLEEEAAANARVESKDGTGSSEHSPHGSRPATAPGSPRGDSGLGRWFGCAKKYQPVEPADGEGERGGRGARHPSLSHHDRGVGHLHHHRHAHAHDGEEGGGDAFDADIELGEGGGGGGGAEGGPSLDGAAGDGSQAGASALAPSLAKSGATANVPSAAAEKARKDAANKQKRRDDKLKAAADAVDAAEKKAAHEAYQAMLAAETAEQKEARRREKQEAHEREKREREEAAENARLRHVQDGLAMAFNKRREGAMLAHLFNPSGTEEGPGNLGAKSLFDIDPDLKARTVIDDRLEARFSEKQEAVQLGGRDVVLDNAGPSAAILPPGWLADPLMPLPLHIDQMNHRRCMVVFNEPKAKGWFFGTVSGTTRRKGYNYSVKFDKAETASIEIDGIKSVNFSDSGEFAYGRGWVLCHRDPDYVPVPGAAFGSFGSRPATTATTGSAAAGSSRPGTQDMSSRPGTQGTIGV